MEVDMNDQTTDTIATIMTKALDDVIGEVSAQV